MEVLLALAASIDETRGAFPHRGSLTRGRDGKAPRDQKNAASLNRSNVLSSDATARPASRALSNSSSSARDVQEALGHTRRMERQKMAAQAMHLLLPKEQA